MNKQIIHVHNVTKYYNRGRPDRRSMRALEKVSFKINEGEIFALLGPNGAGKSTLLKLLLGLTFPTSGKIAILGSTPEDPSFKERIGYLPEEHCIPDNLTAEQFLRFYGRFSNVSPNVLETRVDELLKRVGLSDRRSEPIGDYSKGMKRRLGLAQALINKPDLLLLDEPAGGLDPIGRKLIRNLLRDLRDEGTTILLNSHFLSEVEQIADRVGLLHDGRLTCVDTISALTKSHRSLEDIIISKLETPEV